MYKQHIVYILFHLAFFSLNIFGELYQFIEIFFISFLKDLRTAPLCGCIIVYSTILLSIGIQTTSNNFLVEITTSMQMYTCRNPKTNFLDSYRYIFRIISQKWISGPTGKCIHNQKLPPINIREPISSKSHQEDVIKFLTFCLSVSGEITPLCSLICISLIISEARYFSVHVSFVYVHLNTLRVRLYIHISFLNFLFISFAHFAIQLFFLP